MLLGSLSFAVMSTMAHMLGTRCDWQIIALARSGLAFLFATTLAIFAGSKLVMWRPGILWMRSIAGSISLVGGFFALTRLPVSDVLTLTNTFPIWIAVLSWPVLGEMPSRRVWLSVVCGVSGAALMQQPHFAEGNFAALVALGCSFSTAIAMLGLHRLHAVDVRAIVVHFSGVSFLFCIGSLFCFDRDPKLAALPDGRAIVMLLAIGLTATAGQIMLTKAFKAGAPAKVSVVGLSQVVFAMILDLLLLQHTFDTLKVVGMLLVLGPTAWLMVSERRAHVAAPEIEEECLPV